MSEYRILAADIGGTNSRFAELVINGLDQVHMSETVVFPTWSESSNTFDQLLEHYFRSRPPGSTPPESYDALSIAVAGAVSGKQATLPNIPWDIDLTVSKPLQHTFLLNDFYAQAHGYLVPGIFDTLSQIRPGPGSGPGSIAIVGAGTGLGHAALKPAGGERIVIGSESGHATFSFHGADERAIEASMLTGKDYSWLSGDDVVSGSGAALIHAGLTGEAVSPAEALQKAANESSTCAYFSRFYGRVCRDYCLAMYPVEALIISGGIAAKNPHLVESTSFISEFNDGRSYQHLLERIPVYLNQDEELGIKGAAIHAWQQLIA